LPIYLRTTASPRKFDVVRDGKKECIKVVYILSENRNGSPYDFERGFRRYREQLYALRARFPPSAFAIATADWYYSLSDPRSPHDAWLTELRLIEHPRDNKDVRTRALDISVRLINGRHDRYLDFFYSGVSSYDLRISDGDLGQRDWRYDEFRLTEENKVVHEIEWYGPRPTGRWVIVASEIQLVHSALS
jgi:hypothetical protein